MRGMRNVRRIRIVSMVSFSRISPDDDQSSCSPTLSRPRILRHSQSCPPCCMSASKYTKNLTGATVVQSPGGGSLETGTWLSCPSYHLSPSSVFLLHRHVFSHHSVFPFSTSCRALSTVVFDPTLLVGIDPALLLAVVFSPTLLVCFDPALTLPCCCCCCFRCSRSALAVVVLLVIGAAAFPAIRGAGLFLVLLMLLLFPPFAERACCSSCYYRCAVTAVTPLLP